MRRPVGRDIGGSVGNQFRLTALLPQLRRGDVVLVKASRGVSWTPERRLREGVGLDSVVSALLERREAL